MIAKEISLKNVVNKAFKMQENTTVSHIKSPTIISSKTKLMALLRTATKIRVLLVSFNLDLQALSLHLLFFQDSSSNEICINRKKLNPKVC